MGKQNSLCHKTGPRAEDEIVRAWWELAPGSLLQLNDGRVWCLIFPGHPGGGAGPDVRDAVLSTRSERLVDGQLLRYSGDIEFHMHASDWYAHKHHTDTRYNRVILHVVAYCGQASPPCRQDGEMLSTCSLQDFPLATTLPLPEINGYTWPCHYSMHHLDERARNRLLQYAGILRFEQKVQGFVEQLRDASFEGRAEYDRYLLPALAEGLGYGRDRAFFRAAGQRLAGWRVDLPEPLGRTARPAPLDAARLRVLARISSHWPKGIWNTIHSLLLATGKEANLDALHGAFQVLGLSLARTDILLCNVIFPFAAAVALLERDRVLEQLAYTLYQHHPGLSSNRVTRMMSAQLLLPEEPEGGCRQQGLHYIYQQTCQGKICEKCILVQ